MKLSHLLGAIGLAVTALASDAGAQGYHHAPVVTQRTTVVERRPVVTRQTIVRRTTVRRGYPGAYGRRYQANRWNRHCATHWYHGRRVTRCW